MVDIKTNGYFTMSYQNKPVSLNMDGTKWFFHPPVVLFNVLNQLRLDVWLSWNSDGLLHEWLIEVNFIYLQFQFLGDLEKGTFKQPVNANFKKILNLKSTNKNNNNNQLLKKTKNQPWGQKWQRTWQMDGTPRQHHRIQWSLGGMQSERAPYKQQLVTPQI